MDAEQWFFFPVQPTGMASAACRTSYRTAPWSRIVRGVHFIADGGGTMDEQSAAPEVAAAVRAVYEAGERHDFAALRAFHAEDSAFSRWSGQPGGELLDFAAAQDEEEALFGALAPDTRVTPEQIRVDCFGEVAVSTFTVLWRGPDRDVLRRRRGTLIWHRRAEGWRIVHEHISS